MDRANADPAAGSQSFKKEDAGSTNLLACAAFIYLEKPNDGFTGAQTRRRPGIWFPGRRWGARRRGEPVPSQRGLLGSPA